MNIIIQLLTILTLVIFFSQSINAQTVINKDWKINFGTPNTIDVVETVIGFQENLITTGNTIVSGQNANVFQQNMIKMVILFGRRTLIMALCQK
jgi:hypothetical protein